MTDNLLNVVEGGHVKRDHQGTPKSPVRPSGVRRNEEGEELYRVGGYHPVELGDVLAGRYRIVDKLGWGGFSTVWAARDLASGLRVAVKISRSDPDYSDAARDEIQVLGEIHAQGHVDQVVALLDHFCIHGANGTHLCIVMEILGECLYDMVKFYGKHPGHWKRCYGKGIPIPLVKRVVRDILGGLHTIHHDCQLIHTDLKLENILLSRRISEMFSLTQVSSSSAATASGVLQQTWAKLFGGRSKEIAVELLESGLLMETIELESLVKIADLGSSCWTYNRISDYVSTRQYRSPEVIVGSEYTTAIDIWALGCIVFELVTGQLLFNPPKHCKEGISRNEEHLALIMELYPRGSVPESLLSFGEYSEDYFTEDGGLRNISDPIAYYPLQSILEKEFGLPEYELAGLCEFIMPMLDLNPKTRYTAAQCLAHPWLQ